MVDPKTAKLASKPQKVIWVFDYEFSNEKIEFFQLRGFLKKKLSLLREVPLQDIDAVESNLNQLTLTSKGVTEVFYGKQHLKSFDKLRDQIQERLNQRSELLEEQKKFELRKMELNALIDNALGYVDAIFDVLLQLHEKRINWPNIIQNFSKMHQNPLLSTQTIPPFTIDLSAFSQQITNQSPNKTAKEGYNVLTTIRTYFLSLKPEKETNNTHPDSIDLISLLHSYLILNDVFLGKIVGDKNSAIEISALEKSLNKLSEAMGSKLNIEEIKSDLADFDTSAKNAAKIEGVRATFKSQLINLAAKTQLNPS